MSTKQSLIEQMVNTEIVEMYCEDGLSEREIAEVTGYSITAVHEVLAAYEESDLIVDTYHKRDCAGDVR